MEMKVPPGFNELYDSRYIFLRRLISRMEDRQTNCMMISNELFLKGRFIPSAQRKCV
jgi:hypothetical protein